MQQFNSRQPPPALPAGSFGVSGTHYVPSPSPSLDAAVLGEVEAKDSVRQFGVKALTIAQQQAAAACHASRVIHADPAISAPERHRRAHDISAAAILPSVEPLEKARLVNERAILELQAKLAGPAIELSDARGIEIRTRIEGLKPSDRFAAISRAIERGDDSIAAAVLSQDRFLTSFLSDVEVGAIRAFWAKARFSGEVARLAVLESDRAHIARTGEILRSYQTQCAGPTVVVQPREPLPIGHRPTVYGY